MGQAIQSLEYSAGFVDGVVKGYEIAIDRVNSMIKFYREYIIKADGGHLSQVHETSLNDQYQILKDLERYDPIRDLECRVNFTYEKTGRK